MKKLFRTWTLFIALAMCAFFISCSTDSDDDTDTTAPKAVTEQSVTAANGKAVLKWKNPNDSDFYATKIVISPKTEGEDESVVIPGSAGKESSKVIYGLTNDTEYTFTLYALDKSLNVSEPVTEKATPTGPTDTTAPAAVTDLDVTTENGVATVTWESPSDTDLYAIWIEVSPEFEGENSAMIVEGKPGENGSVDFKGLKDETEYTFSVYAADKSLNFSNVTTKIIKTGSAAPQKVSGLTVKASNAKAVLTWTNPSDSDFYATRIVISPKPKEGNATIVIEGNTKESSSTIVYGLTNGTEYTFTLYALDKAFNVSESVIGTATPTDPSDKTAPAAVTNLTATAKNGTAKLTWTNPSDTDLYAVWVEVSPELEGENSAVIIEGKPSEAGSVDFKGLKDGTEYTFAVYAVDTSLNFSEVATTKATSTTTSAGEVTGLKASYMNDSDGNVKAVLEWKDPTDETLAFVEVSCYEVTDTETLKGTVYVKPGFEGFIATGLTSGSTYKFTVKTIDENQKASVGVSTENITVKYVETTNLSVTLTSETTETTNKDVKVSVGVSGGTVSKITYVKGLKTDAAEILSGTDITSALSFTAEENGYYTVAVKDSADTTVTAIINIENIDKTAPSAPEKLNATYSYANQKIIFTWSSPDSDISHYLVSYSKAGEAVKTDEKVKTETYEATGIDADETGVTYTFTVKAVDTVGNTGKEATTTVTPKRPVITGFTIPKAGTHSKGSTVAATVTGNNFRASGINTGDFGFSCSNNSIANSATVKIESDTKLTVSLTIPDQKGSYEITIKDTKEKSSSTGTFVVTDTAGWEIGDSIVAINNGADFIHLGANDTIETIQAVSKAVVAVVAGFGENGSSILAMGVHRYEYQTCWAENYPGIGIKFKEITKDDTDGSDNWEYIKKTDTTGAQNPKKNYPIFYFAENYGTQYSYTGVIASGWYIPTLKELTEIAKNYGTFKKNFEAAGGFGLSDTYDRFWTSTQADENGSAYTVRLIDGAKGTVNKDGLAYAFVIKAFTADTK